MIRRTSIHQSFMLEEKGFKKKKRKNVEHVWEFSLIHH